MRITPLAAIAALLLAGVGVALLPLGGPQGVAARVIGVTDGDTITVRVGDAPPEKVRLIEIDAPEQGQPYGTASKRELSRRVYGKTVRLERDGEDRYGRTLGRVYVDAEEVNAAMVRSGAAWVYEQYSDDPDLPEVQAQARLEKVGLWSLQEDQVTPPWAWRRGERPEVAVAEPALTPQTPLPPLTLAQLDAPAVAAVGAFTCGPPKTCRQMASCEEALFQLRQCGATRIDGDDDGIPCESICRGSPALAAAG